jgi:carbon starvation protein
MDLLAVTLYSRDPVTGRVLLHAMPVMIVALCCLAIAYRYYSAFLAAKVAALDDSRETPAHRLNDGQNYHPTNKWVLFGHHFAAISGAGPLIGPVLAIQYGFMPGLVWLVIGVCLAGAVQDMLVLAASVRRDGKSIAEIARAELGAPAAILASVAILFIVIIALAGLGFVVVKALGGEEVKLPAGMQVTVPAGQAVATQRDWQTATDIVWELPPGCAVRYANEPASSVRSESFRIKVPLRNSGDDVQKPVFVANDGRFATLSHFDSKSKDDGPRVSFHPQRNLALTLPAGCVQVVPGSSWGTFTIACTIPIALLTGLWMYRIRKGRVVEASIIGGSLTLVAMVAGNWIPGSALEPFFSLTREQTIIALGVYGFIAAVLPVWLLLGPRDYLSSFLKIGTVGLLVFSVCVANPRLEAPPLNEVFINGGPTFKGNIFPFVFICIMCGAVSGFHSLVASGTTPKMVEKESHIRTIGYGSMLIEGLVGITALIAAAALPSDLYYAINVPIDAAPQFQKQVDEVTARYNVKLPPEANDPTHAVGKPHLDLGQVEEKVGGESLRGRTGGAVTLAVGMSVIFEDAFRWLGVTGDWLLKYWYHFAIMFEALFILTTIDAGTRIARFLTQETAGRVYEPFGRPSWLPGAILASAIVTGGWCWLVYTGSIDTIWPMFGIANQLLAALALGLVTTWLVNNGRGKYAWVTLTPLVWVCSTTLTAGVQLVNGRFAELIEKGRAMVAAGDAAGNKLIFTGQMNTGLTLFVMTSVGALLLWCAARWLAVWLRGGALSGPLGTPGVGP